MQRIGGSPSMFRRTELLMRQIKADGWNQRRKDSTDRRLCRFVIVLALLAQLSQAKGKDIPDAGKLTHSNLNNQTREKNSSLLTNEIILDNHDDDDLYLAYSGYLRSSSSMLTPENFNKSLLTNINTTIEPPKANGHRRFKRAVTHLYNMIVCATGCNPLAYKGYGCYCGFLGSGYPMDGIDRCCKMHDWCYEATDCPMFVEYFVPYYWKCYRGYKPICAIEHGEWGSSGSCAQRLCECDRSFAECLRRYRCPRHKAVCTSSPWRLIQNIFMII
ncbi:uncharacterized protein LOC100117598 [Nasonia vitripennis]|uniref:Phospholipase A2 n=1 Tax=Nasonia vitripennis TaxID=7425 RepID=A0A7M7G3Q0_NASVI|nr:uncharacterized protein LOC100117598 [Nasonia vitripennis]